ncbi:hypothetical protein [Vulgatibacter incomptus]|uniref:Bifunctional deaminase-reductase domain protein n=1 Tax=Vulgatibacter incomptus TaxID=1391653 RepID=A0A0K1PGY2_9BACT|nr:hypothetical protein [Vulgatibacter incomptus]AKU92757.1 Bifunctional deaminase-reductase domain protein [Vulgatibacter incomptus]
MTNPLATLERWSRVETTRGSPRTGLNGTADDTRWTFCPSEPEGQGEFVLGAGLIDEFSIALWPVLFGSGIRLFEGVDAGRVALAPVRAELSLRVTHLTYAVRKR